MNEQPPDDAAHPRCPNCDNILLPDSRFCENCGAKIEPRPICRRCGAPLLPDAKFCENCGVPVETIVVSRKSTTIPAAPERILTKPPMPAITPKPESPVVKKATTPPIPAPVAPAREETLPKKIPTIPRSVPEPDEQADEPAPAKIRTLPRLTLEPDDGPVDILSPVPKASPSKMPTIIGGVVGVVVLLVIILVVVMPIFSSPSGTASAISNPVVTGTPVKTTTTAIPTATPRVTTVPTPKITQTINSLIPGPTQALPADQVLIFQTDKDAVSGAVTVTVTGPSRNVVSDIEVLLTRSDGRQQTGHIIPGQKVDEITLPGTRATDRVEVTVRFYSGETYKVIDKLLEFQRRG
ncbi:MAG: zinc ribbon domain-containing protein [Methanoregula sp.]|nr:zinc ribbon domain-containing protein [Methanoregula sp.]